MSKPICAPGWVRCAASGVLALAVATPSLAVDYVVGGATQALTPNSAEWAWDGSYISGFRAALQDPTNFGTSGIVNRSILTVDLVAIDAASLAGLDMFVGTWIADGDVSAAQVEAVKSFFLGGGDLFLLQDDPDHDPIGEALGLSTSASSGTVSNGGAPLYNGPFGVATDVKQNYLVGQLDAAAVALLGGTVAGTNASGQVTSAYWAAGSFAAGSGALFINADIDMIATTTACGLPLCGADYSPLNDNGVFALNTFAFIQQNGGSTPPIPEPSTYALMLLGLSGLAWVARRRKPSGA